MWLWNLTDDLAKHYSTSSVLHQAVCIISKPWVNLNWSYSPETLNLGQDRWFFVLCNLEIWWMTLKNNRAPLLCCFKLCASLHSHQWIQIEVTVQKIKLCASFQSQLWVQASVTVRKCSIWVKISFFFCSVWLWNLMDDLEKQYGTASILHQALHIISKPWVNSNWSYSPEMLK